MSAAAQQASPRRALFAWVAGRDDRAASRLISALDTRKYDLVVLLPEDGVLREELSAAGATTEMGDLHACPRDTAELAAGGDSAATALTGSVRALVDAMRRHRIEVAVTR